MADKQAKSDIDAVSMGKPFVKKLGGMPPKKNAEEVIKANDPGARSPAPGSFRPGGKEAKD